MISAANACRWLRSASWPGHGGPSRQGCGSGHRRVGRPGVLRASAQDLDGKDPEKRAARPGLWTGWSCSMRPAIRTLRLAGEREARPLW